jgi:hypothetical protein
MADEGILKSRRRNMAIFPGYIYDPSFEACIAV